MTDSVQTPSTFPREIFEASMLLVQKQRWLSKVSQQYCELLDSCPSDGHRQMLIDLLARTTYVSAEEYFDFIVKMREHVEVVWKLEPATTLFVSSNKGHADSSREVLNQLKSTAWTDPAWTKHQFHVAFTSAIRNAKDGDTLVITDDFVGSGGSMSKALKWLSDAAAQKKISLDLRVLTVSGCAEGIAVIQKAGHAVQCMVTIAKGLSGHLSGELLSAALAQMADLEDALALEINDRVKFVDYRLGWKQQEAVYVRQGGNTPNNVFPVFWWKHMKSRTRTPIMNRT